MAEHSGDERLNSAAVEVDADEIETSELNFLKAMQTSFAIWGVGFEVMRAYVEEWTRRRQVQMQEAMSKLGEAVQLETPELRANAVSDIFVEQMQASIKDFAAAGYKAMTYAGAYGKKLVEDRGAGMGMGAASMGFGMGPPQPPSPPEAPVDRGRPPTSKRRSQRKGPDA